MALGGENHLTLTFAPNSCTPGDGR